MTKVVLRSVRAVSDAPKNGFDVPSPGITLRPSSQRPVLAYGHEYGFAREKQLKSAGALVRDPLILNGRQLALLGHALKNPDALYTIKSHQTIHDVVYETARTDLLDLAGDGLLIQTQEVKAFVFRPVSELKSTLRNL